MNKKKVYDMYVAETGGLSVLHEKLSDEELIHSCFPHQPDICFETLYNRYSTKVYHQCLSMTKDGEKAQDFTHDIFLKVFDKLGSFQRRSSFSTWLYAIAKNYCSDQFRLAKRECTIRFEEEVIANIPDSTEAQLQKERLQLLEQAFASLASGDQTVLRLKYEDNLSIDEIARMLILTNSAVKMRLKRSREKLQLLYDQHSNR